jgi:hypothetical protein
MNYALRAIHLIVLTFLVVYATQAPGLDSAATVGWWIGFIIMAISPAMSLFALSRNASAALRRHTRRVIVGVFILLAIFGGCAMTEGSRFDLSTALGLGLLFLPSMLTLWRLRVADLQERGEHREPDGWFLGNLWRGEYSLGATIWGSGAIFLLISFMALAGLGLLTDRVSLVVTARLLVGVFALIILLALFHGVGIWRAAGNSARRGARAWALLARLGVLADLAGGGWIMWQYQWPQIREHALIALERDPLAPLQVDVTTNGTVLLLHGTFGTGSADKVRAALESTPGIRIIALSSSGGRLREADEIAQLARERKLDTYVDTRCESACTYVFLAGAERAATPNARIGFHSPSFAGVNPLGQRLALGRMLGTYKNAGVPENFLARIAQTDASAMWYPTAQELQDAGVINRVSLGGETSAIAALTGHSKEDIVELYRNMPVMKAVERHFPGTIEEAARVAWVAHLEGHADTALNTATRSVLAARFPQILATADDARLDDFARLLLDQMQAARELGFDACHLLLLGSLNIEQVLPPQLVEREIQLTLDILAADSLVSRPPVDQLAFQEVSAAALETMDQKRIDVVANPAGYMDQPQLRCESYIDFYERVLKLPEERRHVMLRGMFQMD